MLKVHQLAITSSKKLFHPFVSNDFAGFGNRGIEMTNHTRLRNDQKSALRWHSVIPGKKIVMYPKDIK